MNWLKLVIQGCWKKIIKHLLLSFLLLSIQCKKCSKRGLLVPITGLKGRRGGIVCINSALSASLCVGWNIEMVSILLLRWVCYQWRMHKRDFMFLTFPDIFLYLILQVDFGKLFFIPILNPKFFGIDFYFHPKNWELYFSCLHSRVKQNSHDALQIQPYLKRTC